MQFRYISGFAIACYATLCLYSPALGEQAPMGDKANIVVFPAPTGIKASGEWKLKVEGREVFCYQDYRLNRNFPPTLFKMKVSPQAYAIFDFAGRVKIAATLKSDAITDLRGLKIRPLAAGIRPRITGNTIEFELDEPCDVTIDPAGTGLCVLHLFTNPPETLIPKKDDPNIVYFGPGVHDIDEVELKSGQTLYLAGGAVVRPYPSRLRKPAKDRHYTGIEYHRAISPIRVTGNDITVRGRGVISGERGLPAGRRFGLFRGFQTNRLRIEGVVFTRPTGWTVVLMDCRNSVIERTRVLGYFTNSDGFCLYNCRDCKVTDSFIHTADDCYEVKGKGSGIVFENSQAWCDAGTNMGVCHEIDGLMTDIVWQNMTVLHYTYRLNPHQGVTSRGAIHIHPAKGGTVRNVRFENITVENCSTERPLILVYNVKKPKDGIHFFPDKPFSEISNVVFKKIRAENVSNPEILIMDQSGNGLVKEITFKDVIINGCKLIESDSRLTIAGGVKGIHVE